MPRKGENIFKRKDGRWEGRYIKERDIQNKAIYGYVYAKTYLEVRDKLAEAKYSVTCRDEIKDKRLFEYFCKGWIIEIKKRIKASTYAKYCNILKNHIVPSLGRLRISCITTDVIKQYSADKLGTGLSVKTVRDILSVLKGIFEFAQSEGAVCNCSFSEISVKSSKKNISILTQNEYTQFLDYLMTDTDNTKLGILICLCTGIRIGEVCALKYDDISDGCIFVSKTMQRIQTMTDSETKTEVCITEPKSESSIRYVPIPLFLNEPIQKLYCRNAYILTGEAERYIEPRTLQNRFKKHLELCGISNVNFHICRHTYASYCVEAGVEIKCLSEMLGHSSVNITLNRYVHSSLEQKKENIEKFNRKFFYSPSENSSAE